MDTLTEEDLLCFYYRPLKDAHRGVFRVVLQGQNLGEAKIVFAHGANGTDKFLRPYFDPATGFLRFQTVTGEDYPYAKDLAALAASPKLRPLLQLAHSEGLLDKIPGEASAPYSHETSSNLRTLFGPSRRTFDLFGPRTRP